MNYNNLDIAIILRYCDIKSIIYLQNALEKKKTGIYDKEKPTIIHNSTSKIIKEYNTFLNHNNHFHHNQFKSFFSVISLNVILMLVKFSFRDVWNT